MTKDAFLSARWNNSLSLGLGLLTLVYVSAIVITSAATTNDAFIGLVILGSFL